MTGSASSGRTLQNSSPRSTSTRRYAARGTAAPASGGSSRGRPRAWLRSTRPGFVPVREVPRAGATGLSAPVGPGPGSPPARTERCSASPRPSDSALSLNGALDEGAELDLGASREGRVAERDERSTCCWNVGMGSSGVWGGAVQRTAAPRIPGRVQQSPSPPRSVAGSAPRRTGVRRGRGDWAEPDARRRGPRPPSAPWRRSAS